MFDEALWQPCFAGGLTIYLETLHVGCVSFGAGRVDDDLACGTTNLDGLKEGAAENELRAARNLRVQSHRGPDIPGRHLAEVVVAGHAFRGICPDRVEHTAHSLLGLPRLAEEVEEPRGL